MAKLTIEIDPSLGKALDRIVRDGWYVDRETLVLEAVKQLVEAKTHLGDSPPLLHRFAADAMLKIHHIPDRIQVDVPCRSPDG